jgi:phosphohistidine phosphatase
MKAMALDFDLVLSSPYRRAQETAEIVVDLLGARDLLKLFEPLAAEFPAERAVRELRTRCSGLNSVLLVGHEPQLSTIGSILLSETLGLSLTLKKGGLFKLWLDRIEPGTATLKWWLTPRQLRQLRCS